jgi:hypothetical protein
MAPGKFHPIRVVPAKSYETKRWPTDQLMAVNRDARGSIADLRS